MMHASPRRRTDATRAHAGNRWATPGMLALALACGREHGGDAGVEGSASAGATMVTAAGDSADTAVDFILQPDGGPVLECDTFARDCPAGSKCMPWAADGGDSWNATHCVMVPEGAAAPGEPCTVEGSPVSGIDDCDETSMCYFVGTSDGLGICVPFCGGTLEVPTCAAATVCSAANGGVLNICRSLCDPLVQDCPLTASCLPTASRDQFVCVLDGSDGGGKAGAACEFANACAPGLFCAAPATVPGCDSSVGCCSHLCDLTAPDADEQCTIGGGQECVPWFDPGTAPAAYANVGACALPQ